MRLPRPRLHLRPRFRLRTLLIAVAVVAVTLGGWTMWKRREYCLERAEFHASVEEHMRRGAEEADRWSEEWREDAERFRNARSIPRRPGEPVTSYYETWAGRSESRAASLRRSAESRARLMQAFRHVARYPWLPLPSEPE